MIPLRPLSLSDIFNGAVGYIRAYPKPTLGLTTAVVLITSVIGFFAGLAAGRVSGDAASAAGLVTAATTTVLANTLLSGMLTAIVARAVRGLPITVGEAWQRVRDRIGALIGLTLLELAAMATLGFALVLVVIGLTGGAGAAVAVLLGIPLALGLLGGVAYLYASLALAPSAIVLERKSVPDAIRRSFELSRPRFWRIFGILLLAGLVSTLVSGALSVPFDVLGGVMSIGSGANPGISATAAAAMGQAIGQILTAPFVAGVVTLLYVDSRIRSEAFDFALIGAAPNDDSVWLR
ncbi:MAG: hypothetical protein ACKOQ4_07555 [Mycobacterium sp.]